MTTGIAPRLIAFYLPQYHPIPENDEWWGKGFTEWTNVVKAKPLFKNHYQPHVPADLGFYDLRVPETRQAQAEMAKQYGLEGFCYWHYWFAGKRLLEQPFDEVLQSGQPDFPFCLAWANATWTGIWYGASEKILIEQTYPGMEDHKAHFQSLLHAFRDYRYIKVDGKPLFLVLQPSELNEGILDLWRELSISAGLEGLFLLGIVKDAAEVAYIRELGFDACTISRTSGRSKQDNHFLDLLARSFGEQKVANLYQKILRRPFHVYDHRDAVPYIPLDGNLGLEFFPCVLPNWDNTARSGLNGHVFTNSSPALFQEHLRQAIKLVEGRDAQHQIIIVKSWNEWAEGNHLEPDLKFGRGFLEAMRDEVETARKSGRGSSAN